MSRRGNVGIVGARSGPALASGFRATEGVDVTALCTKEPLSDNARADACAIPLRFTDFDQMLDSDIDLVFVSTPM